MDIKKTVGTRINSALARCGMLQKDLAKVLGVTDNTISYYCKGVRGPQLEQLPKIAKALNTTTDYLLGLSDVITDDVTIQKIVEKSGLYEDVIIRLMCLQGSIDPKSSDAISYYSDCPEWIADNSEGNLKIIFRIFVNLLLKAAFDSTDEVLASFYPSFLIMTAHYGPVSNVEDADNLAKQIDDLARRGYAALDNHNAVEWYISKLMNVLKTNMLEEFDELSERISENVYGSVGE